MNIYDPKLETTESKRAAQDWQAHESLHKGKFRALWMVVVVLAIALGGMAYYGHRSAHKLNAQMGQLSHAEVTLSALGQRMDAAESKLRDWASGWDGLAGRVTKLEGKINRNLQLARKHAQELTERLHQQVRAEIETHTRVLETRVHQVESEQAAQNSRLAQVETQLRREMAAIRQETGRDLDNVQRQVGTTSRNLDALSQRLDRRRVDFELAKGQTTELVPGVTLRVDRTNVSYQRFGGWVWLLPDRRTLWLRNQIVHQPVRFYHKHGGEPYELVVTDVTKRFVIGYLLVPTSEYGTSAAATASATGDTALGRP